MISELIPSVSAHLDPSISPENNFCTLFNEYVIQPIILKVYELFKKVLPLLHVAFIWLYLPFPIRFIAYVYRAHSLLTDCLQGNSQNIVKEAILVIKVIRATAFLYSIFSLGSVILDLAPFNILNSFSSLATAWVTDELIQQLI